MLDVSFNFDYEPQTSLQWESDFNTWITYFVLKLEWRAESFAFMDGKWSHDTIYSLLVNIQNKGSSAAISVLGTVMLTDVGPYGSMGN